MGAFELALWYSSKAKLCWRQAEEYFRQFRYPECASSYEESIEFAAKAICEFYGQRYDWKHGVSDGLINLSATVQGYKLQFTRAAWISSRWVGMEQRARTLIRYGNQQAKIPATKIVGRKDVEPLKEDAFEICRLLCRIEFAKKFEPPIRIGILNGRVDNSDETEKPCGVFPFSEFKGLDVWKDRFAKITLSPESKYIIEEISVSQVTNDFAIVINPFGEAYPEKDIPKKFAFNILKDYIADGGVYVNIAGFPFFYAWDVAKGKEEPVVDEKILIPESIGIKEGKIVAAAQFRVLLNFAGSLLWREFGALTTMGDVQELEVYQTAEDKNIAGDIVAIEGSNKVNEFRALRHETKNLIPILRASRPDFGEIYPIAAFKHGWGYIVAAGMHLKTNVEFEKLIAALDSFCSWLKKNC
jgi:HEPN domain-containing protein